MRAEAFAIHGLTMNSSRTSSCSRRRWTTSSPSRRRAARHPQCRVRYRIPQCRARAPGPAADRPRANDRHPAHRPPQASRRIKPARRPVRALRDRQFSPHQARRAARCRAAGRGLCRVDRRPPGATRSFASGRPRHASGEASSCASARCRSRPGSRPRSARRTGRFIATLGESAIWRDYVSSD